MASQSFVGAVLDQAATRPDAIALVEAQREVRYATLARDIEAAAATLSAEQDAVKRVLGPKLYIDYGAVDFSMIAVQGPDDAPEIGARLVPGLEAEVLGPDDRPLPFGAEGRLRVRAPWAPTGYANGSASPQFRDGWFYPGDLAILGEDRRIRLVGRADDLINRGGIKIAPEPIEALLVAHPDVHDAAVVGVPHAIAGEMPVAFVVLRDPAALEALRQWSNARIETQRQPAAFVTVNEIPRSAEGKVLRARLRALVKAT